MNRFWKSVLVFNSVAVLVGIGLLCVLLSRTKEDDPRAGERDAAATSTKATHREAVTALTERIHVLEDKIKRLEANVAASSVRKLKLKYDLGADPEKPVAEERGLKIPAVLFQGDIRP